MITEKIKESKIETALHLFQVFEGKMSNITKCGKCGKEMPETNAFISILLSINVENDKMYDVVRRLNTSHPLNICPTYYIKSL